VVILFHFSAIYFARTPFMALALSGADLVKMESAERTTVWQSRYSGGGWFYDRRGEALGIWVLMTVGRISLAAG
jgi:hypothetical protein